jgi:hypothetical protein
MPVRRIALNAVTHTGRHLAVHEAGEAVHAVGGWIDDVHFFSNLSATLRCIVPASGVLLLADRLGVAGLTLTSTGIEALALAAREEPPDQELACSLQISFVHDEPDLRRHVPSVPG